MAASLLKRRKWNHRIREFRKENRPSVRVYADGETPKSCFSAIHPINLAEAKELFLRHGVLVDFIHKGSVERVAEILKKKRAQINFDFLPEATNILMKVKQTYGCAEDFSEACFGARVDVVEASDILEQYIDRNGLTGVMQIYFSSDLPCSGRMVWSGPHVKCNKPESRRYSLWVKNSTDNPFLRRKGITCLADHEIGTHYYRAWNDGIQPWYSDRSRFGISGNGHTFLVDETEEGLATLNTILRAELKYLFIPALLYYIACMSAKMTFKELFHHLECFVRSPELRWKYVVRVKRGLRSPTNDLGGYGKDQMYFSGAVKILKDLDNIDFKLMYAGRLSLDDMTRVKRLARLECIQLPEFLKDISVYKKKLRGIARVNGLSSPRNRSLSTSSNKKKSPSKDLNRIRVDSKPNIAAQPGAPVKSATEPSPTSEETSVEENDDYSHVLRSNHRRAKSSYTSLPNVFSAQSSHNDPSSPRPTSSMFSVYPIMTNRT